MKDITWGRNLSVEVDEIDSDHRKLVNLFNLLAHAVADGEAPVYLVALLDELISCTAWHFKHEERLMVKYVYADYVSHKAEHDDLIAAGKELQQRFPGDGDQDSKEKDIEYLERWLVEHILVTDMKLGDYLVEKM